SRSIVTHVTVAMSLLALLLFGGQAIHSFTATMMFGVVLVGTYTSVFIASPILIYLGVGRGRVGGAEEPESPPTAPAAAPVSAAPASRRAKAPREGFWGPMVYFGKSAPLFPVTRSWTSPHYRRRGRSSATQP